MFTYPSTYLKFAKVVVRILSLTGKCKIRQNIFVALQQCNIGSNNFSSRNSKSLEFHSNFLEGGSQTNPSTGRMPARQVKILCAKCVTIVTLALAESVAPITLLSLFAEFLT